MITRIGTYLPIWSGRGGRRAGPDEDAITLAVEAGRSALGETDAAEVRLVTLVTRDLPLMEGGNAAALLAGLDLPRITDVIERVGGAPTMLDALTASGQGTLVIGADTQGQAGAAAAWCGATGGALSPVARVHRSLPLRARGQDGVIYEDEDPRLQRERGVRASMEASELPGKPVAVAGLSPRDAALWCEGGPADLPTVGASAVLFGSPCRPTSVREASSQPSIRPRWPRATGNPGPSPSNTTSDLRWRSRPGGWSRARISNFPSPPTTARSTPSSAGPRDRVQRAEPSRFRRGFVVSAVAKRGSTTLVPLPRTGTIYTATTIHVPVPGLSSPYTLAVVQLDNVDVRDWPRSRTPSGDRGHRRAGSHGLPQDGHAERHPRLRLRLRSQRRRICDGWRSWERG